MSKISLVVSDVDGTLVTSDKVLTARARAAVARLSAAGHNAYSPPIQVSLGGSRIKVFCVEDPDGVVIEFMQFLGEVPAPFSNT